MTGDTDARFGVVRFHEPWKGPGCYPDKEAAVKALASHYQDCAGGQW